MDALRFAQAHLEIEEEYNDESCRQHRPIGEQLLTVAKEMEIDLESHRETVRWVTDQILEMSMEEEVEYFGQLVPDDSEK